jgi:hypothetical protein
VESLLGTNAGPTVVGKSAQHECRISAGFFAGCVLLLHQFYQGDKTATSNVTTHICSAAALADVDGLRNPLGCLLLLLLLLMILLLLPGSV